MSSADTTGPPRRGHDLTFEAIHPGLQAPSQYGDGCFICHRLFDQDVQETKEDVVPKWMLKSLGLGNAGAGLPNSRIFGYGRRKVPCCLDCNQRMSASLEGPVSSAFAEGCDSVRELDFTVLFLWLAKIYYGTRFRETGLRDQVRDQDAQPMLAQTDLEVSGEHLRKCLLHRPDQLSFATQPASILVFRSGLPADRRNRFDYFVPTMPPAELVAIRYNDVFVVAIFGDNGHWGQQFGRIRIVHEALATLVLHPVQCDELMLWFAAEAGGAHTSSGCYDLMTTGSDVRSPRSVLIPQFKVEATDAPRSILSLMRTNTLLKRINAELGADELTAIGAAERPPTTLFNAYSEELVQATCFERTCPEVFRLAGWAVPPGARCPACLA